MTEPSPEDSDITSIHSISGFQTIPGGTLDGNTWAFPALLCLSASTHLQPGNVHFDHLIELDSLSYFTQTKQNHHCSTLNGLKTTVLTQCFSYFNLVFVNHLYNL